MWGAWLPAGVRSQEREHRAAPTLAQPCPCSLATEASESSEQGRHKHFCVAHLGPQDVPQVPCGPPCLATSAQILKNSVLAPASDHSDNSAVSPSSATLLPEGMAHGAHREQPQIKAHRHRPGGVLSDWAEIGPGVPGQPALTPGYLLLSPPPCKTGANPPGAKLITQPSLVTCSQVATCTLRWHKAAK